MSPDESVWMTSASLDEEVLLRACRRGVRTQADEVKRRRTREVGLDLFPLCSSASSSSLSSLSSTVGFLIVCMHWFRIIHSRNDWLCAPGASSCALTSWVSRPQTHLAYRRPRLPPRRCHRHVVFWALCVLMRSSMCACDSLTTPNERVGHGTHGARLRARRFRR